MTRPLTLALVLSVAAAGCAGASRSSGSPSSSKGGELVMLDENGHKIVCRKEKPTGSNIAELMCRRQADADAQRLQTQDMLKTTASPQITSGR
jgi:hypothetical protein